MNPGKQVRAGLGGLYTPLLPPGILARARDYFAYVVDIIPLAANTTESSSFQVESDSDFLLVSANGVVTDPTDPLTIPADIPPLLVAINDTGSGRLLQSRAVHWETMFGTAQLPGILPYPKLIPKNSTVQVTVRNLDTVDGWDIRMTFAGFKIFDFPAEG